MDQLENYDDPEVDPEKAYVDFTFIGPSQVGKTSFILTYTQD